MSESKVSGKRLPADRDARIALHHGTRDVIDSGEPERESSRTLFIVEDDSAAAHALTSFARVMSLRTEVFESAETFLDAYDPSCPGCLVLDYKLPGQNGMQLYKKLIEMGSILPVIMISGHGTVEVAVDAMKSGALTFLQKPIRAAVFREAIQQAHSLDASRRRAAAETTEIEAKIAKLTAKEREVMHHVAQGKTNRQIAKELGLSSRGVEDRRARMMRKLDAVNLAEVIRIAQRASMPPEPQGGASPPGVSEPDEPAGGSWR